MKNLLRHGRRPVGRLTRPQVGGAFALFAFGLFALHSLWSRVQWERDRVVEICVDGEEIRSLSDTDDDKTLAVLSGFSEAGVQSVSAYWDPSYTLSSVLSEWAPRVPEGMDLTLRPEAAAFSDWRQRWARSSRLGRVSFPPVSHVLFSGPSVLGFPETSVVESWISSSALTLPWMEFSRQRGTDHLWSVFPDRMVRGHTVSEEEMAEVRMDRVLSRYRRAVRERGARFLYVRLFPGLSAKDNTAFVGTLIGALEKDGFRMGRAHPRYEDFPVSLWRWPRWARQCVALMLALVGPLLGLRWALQRREDPWAPARLTAVTLVSLVAVSVFLSTPDFTLGLAGFRGIKLALLGPLAVALFGLYRAKEIRHFLQEPINVERLLLGLVFLGGVGTLVLRSGHGTPLDAGAAELQLRGLMEELLGVRPRFKEFLIGHPFLILAFYLRRKFPEGVSPFPDLPGAGRQALYFLFHDTRPFLLVGFLGQLSMLNTFFHAHTPLAVSALRTFHGLWMGGLLGAAAVGLFQWGHRRWGTVRP